MHKKAHTILAIVRRKWHHIIYYCKPTGLYSPSLPITSSLYPHIFFHDLVPVSLSCAMHWRKFLYWIYLKWRFGHMLIQGELLLRDSHIECNASKPTTYENSPPEWTIFYLISTHSFTLKVLLKLVIVASGVPCTLYIFFLSEQGGQTMWSEQGGQTMWSLVVVVIYIGQYTDY